MSNANYIDYAELLPKLVNNKINVVLADMGSGKSTAIAKLTEQFLKEKFSVKVLSPFVSTKTSYNRTFNIDEKYTNGYLMTVLTQAVNDITKGALYSPHDLITGVHDWFANRFTSKVVLLDEFEFFFKQAYVENDRIFRVLNHNGSSSIEYIDTTSLIIAALTGMNLTAHMIIGFTATNYDYAKHGVYVNLIKINKSPVLKWNNINVHDTKNLTSGRNRFKYFHNLLRTTGKTLVFVDDRHLNKSFLNNMMSSGLNFCLIARSEKNMHIGHKDGDKHGFDSMFSKLREEGRYFKIGIAGSELTDGEFGNNHFDTFDIILVQVSSARANNLTQYYDHCSVVILADDSKISSEAIQVMGRFRKSVPNIYIIGQNNDDIIERSIRWYDWFYETITGKINMILATQKTLSLGEAVGEAIGNSVNYDEKIALITRNIRIVDLFDAGITQHEIAKEFSLSVSTVKRIIKDSKESTSFQYTMFTSKFEKVGKLIKSSWTEFCNEISNVPVYESKDEQPLIKLGAFVKNERTNKLALINGVEIDYDAGIVDIEHAADMMTAAGIKCVVTNTFSNNDCSSKWRIFVPTRRIVSASSRQYIVKTIDDILGGISAKESYTMKQIYFIGSNGNDHKTFIIDGEFVDVAKKDEISLAKIYMDFVPSLNDLVALTVDNKFSDTHYESNIIQDFNDGHDLQQILISAGYTKIGSKFKAPGSANGAGVFLSVNKYGNEVVYSHHANDVLANGRFNDAFSVFVLVNGFASAKEAISYIRS